MLAVDTNVVVPLLVNDDPRQGAIARRLLESAWVLESVYELAAADAAEALRGSLGLANVRVEDAGTVAAALDAASKGLELADALPLLRAPAGRVQARPYAASAG